MSDDLPDWETLWRECRRREHEERARAERVEAEVERYRKALDIIHEAVVQAMFPAPGTTSARLPTDE